jgi:hypothetical protein
MRPLLARSLVFPDTWYLTANTGSTFERDRQRRLCPHSVSPVLLPNSDDPAKARKVQEAFDIAISKIESLGAKVQDPAEIPSMEEWMSSKAEWTVMTTEFKEDIAKYLKEMTSSDVHTLEDIIKWAHRNYSSQVTN